MPNQKIPSNTLHRLASAAVCFLMLTGEILAAPSIDPVQEILDRQRSWIEKIDNLQATVVSQFGFKPGSSHSVTTSTLYTEGEKFRVEKILQYRGRGGSVEFSPKTLFWNGDTYTEIEYAYLSARSGNLPANRDNPYGTFQLPFLQYSWVTVETNGKNSIKGLQDPSLWNAEHFPVKNISDQNTSAGLERTVTFQWDHGAEVPYIVENDMTFSEAHNFLPVSFQNRLIDKKTSQSRIGSIGKFDEWTTVSLGNGNQDIALPMEYSGISFDEKGEVNTKKLLQCDSNTLKINQDIDSSIFKSPAIPYNYRLSDTLTGKILTTDTEVLRRWNEIFTRKSCLECAQTTSVENLPSGDLTVELRLTGTNDQSLAGRPYKIFYRYGNCCVLFDEGLLSGDSVITLEHVPGKVDKFEYPVYVEDVLVTTLEPEKSGAINVQVAPLTKQKAPDISLVDMFTSETATLSSFKGKRVVLDFWGIDCAPCRPTLLNLNKFASATRSTSTVFMAVTTRFGDPDRTSHTTRFISDNDITAIRHFWAPVSTVDYLGSNGVPLTVLIDEAGQIVWRGNPGDAEFEKVLLTFIDG